MQLTFYSDYSFRVLFYLANMDKQTATITEISNFYDISKNHLVKVVHRLAQQGFIVSLRGKGGGIRLTKKPSEIKISDVVQETEPNFTLVECFNAKTNQCVITNACRLRGIMNEALMAFFRVLENYTLADTVNNKLSKQIAHSILKQP